MASVCQVMINSTTEGLGDTAQPIGTQHKWLQKEC